MGGAGNDMKHYMKHGMKRGISRQKSFRDEGSSSGCSFQASSVVSVSARQGFCSAFYHELS